MQHRVSTAISRGFVHKQSYIYVPVRESCTFIGYAGYHAKSELHFVTLFRVLKTIGSMRSDKRVDLGADISKQVFADRGSSNRNIFSTLHT